MMGITGVIKKATKRSTLLLGTASGLLIGGLSSVAVMAAIPDTEGMIHACYRTGGLMANGAVRIIDSPSAACNSNETAISWTQNGGESLGGFVSDDLPNADFTGASLQYRDLHGMNFQGGTFREARLTGADARNANFSNVSLNYFFQAENAKFESANMTGVLLGGYGSSMRSASFVNADFTNASVLYTGNPSSYDGTNFSGANFTGTLFSVGDFSPPFVLSSNFSNAQFVNATLTGVNLVGADIAGTTWSNTTCPDGTNSDNNGNTCVGHLNP